MIDNEMYVGFSLERLTCIVSGHAVEKQVWQLTTDINAVNHYVDLRTAHYIEGVNHYVDLTTTHFPL